MHTWKLNMIGLVLILLTAGCIEKVHTADEIVGDYLGCSVPTDMPEIFAPGLVSTGLNERDMTFSPDGNELFYSLMCGRQGVLIHVVREDGFWGRPAIASFSGKYSDLEPCISPDGSKLFFASQRPKDGTDAKDYDIWVCHKEVGEWGEPINLGAPVNTAGNEFYPSLTNDGTLYFTAVYEGRNNADDIYRSRLVDGIYAEVEMLPDVVNSMSYEYNAFIAPDESYLLYTAHGRDGSLGGGDIFINFRNEDDSWSAPVNLGNAVNTAYPDYCPFVTRDGKYLYFTSSRLQIETRSIPDITYESLRRKLNGSGNGGQDIYWISAEFLENLRPQ